MSSYVKIMFSNHGIQSVTVVFNNAKNCFLHLSSKLISHLSLSENQALELSWGDGSPVFLSWTQNRSSCSLDGHDVELCRQMGEKLGLRDGEQGFLRPHHQVSSVHRVFVEPLSSDDWEILELHSAALEQQLLDQIRVVFQDAVFPVWVDGHTAIYIQIASLSPSVPYGRLEQFTELVVSPKSRTRIGPLSGSPVRNSKKQQNTDLSNSSGPSLENTTPVPQIHQWGGIADLKSMLRYLIKGSYDPVNRLPPLPDIPFLFNDSIYRVCGAPPDSRCTISQISTAVIHLFPWSHEPRVGPTGDQSPVTYGLLSKVVSPKESRDRAKLAMEKKKNAGLVKVAAGEEVKEEEATVVRVVCHDSEKLTCKESSHSRGEIHSGRVWIPQPLAMRLNIIQHSTVRIKPVISTIKVASAICLQPLTPLVSLEEDDDEIKTAFLGWLHTQSHEPLACLTARSGTILLHGTDGDLFSSYTTYLHGWFKQGSFSDFPFLFISSILSGIDELSRTGFDFISHSLLGSPLSRELGTTGRGLQGGALLITGAKGSGKSTLSQALCRKAREDLDAHVELLDCKKLQGLMDAVDEVLVHGSLVCLIITSQSEHSLHPSLTEMQGSHFIQGFVHIQPSDQAQRAEILHRLILRKKSTFGETLQTLNLADVAKETEGYTPQDLLLLLERAIHFILQLSHHRFVLSGVCLSQRDFVQALKGFTPPSLWGVDLHTPSGVGLERVGGLREVRQQLMDTILLPAKYPILFSNLPIRHRSGILLYGAPGTGKTLLARAVAKDSGMNFISIKGPELLSKYIGASEQGVRDVFQRAQAAKPCILFFDEFDSLAPRRGHDSTGVTDRVVNQLLTQLDGVEGLQGVYVLAATSRPDLIDPALLRPGRLDKSLYCPPPDLVSRAEILKALSAGVALAADVDLEQLAAATEQFTGADLKALLYNAQLEAVHNNLLMELTSGSDSDMSLSSMIFPNNSSGSDDSVGEGDPGVGLDQSMILLEPSDLQAEDGPHYGNVWRIYFGSSFESESLPTSGPNSRCVSGPNSLTHDLTRASAREAGRSLTPAYMSSLQSGYNELGPEQLDCLQQDVNSIKNNYRRANVGDDMKYLLVVHAKGFKSLLLSYTHLHLVPSILLCSWQLY
uniref:Peroxisomal ATPase PEX1 n=1 Tax=Gasterosteus aculeatus aculeatus TaxID=481459 RepID=G3NQT8_GASAC